jgi:hypothetical protein
MTPPTLATLLVAMALLMLPGPAGPRSRLRQSSNRASASACVTGSAQRSVHTDVEPLALAGAWELLAACLRAGVPVPVAVRAVAEGLDEPAGPALLRTAELLALGADSMQA